MNVFKFFVDIIILQNFQTPVDVFSCKFDFPAKSVEILRDFLQLILESFLFYFIAIRNGARIDDVKSGEAGIFNIFDLLWKGAFKVVDVVAK
ncbi:Tre2p, putative [Babesia ovata]|uniref:Tre2p, putative n=1 Tax=Babesia ovata TaxID=189622 RepID=A0A2H6KJU2_9APIC|nr:Tre2p, putative [Babesia ovata]GBE63251.1 Tre2p, putative [Babesia ovata]